MTFGENGKHRDHRSGGNKKRSDAEIFIDTFQGKLAECAVSNAMYFADKEAIPDFSKSGLGTWDAYDLNVNDKKLCIKSTKSYGNLLLLECKDWNQEGEYLPNKVNGEPCAYDYFVLVRIKPHCDELFDKNDWKEKKNLSKEEIESCLNKEKWIYDYGGWISREDLKYIINNDYRISKNSILNKTQMDADNYYIQCADMRNIEDLINLLRRK